MSTVETVAGIVGLIIGFSTVITVSAAGVRWLTKHYFDEIKAEFKPNGGSSLKDQDLKKVGYQIVRRQRIPYN